MSNINFLIYHQIYYNNNNNLGTEEEAAEAYDIAAIKFRGLNAVTNFDMSRYDVKAILESNTLPIGGGAAKRLKEAQALETSRKREEMIALGNNSTSFHYGTTSSSGSPYPPLLHHHHHHHPTSFDAQPLLTLQNQELSQYGNGDETVPYHHQQSYMQTQLQLQLQLQQQQTTNSYFNNNNNNNYNNYLQSNPVLLHGLMNMMDHNNGGGSSSAGSYSGGGGSGYLGVATNNSVSGNNHGEELAMVKVDYDHMASTTSYNANNGGWTGGGGSGGESVQGTNPSLFTMWND